MSEPKFTPGPWIVETHELDLNGRRQKTDIIRTLHRAESPAVTICGMSSKREIGFDIMSCNANLIAAAPDLYAELDRSTDLLEDALKRLPKGCGLYRCIEEQIAENNKVLRKARGEG